MKCLLIFDHLNDIVFKKYDRAFFDHITELATAEGLINEVDKDNEEIDDNVVVQVFSPIITSQRIMSCQFGNSYTSIQCEDGLNMCFDEYMGYLFVAVGSEQVAIIKRFISICMTIVRYLCGPDVCQLKSNEKVSKIAAKLIDSWEQLQAKDQAVFVEAVEQLVVNTDLGSATIQALRRSVDKLHAGIECSKIHALVLVENKFLSLYSSQNAKDLSAADVLFCILLSHSIDDETATSLKDDDNFPSVVHSFRILLNGSSSSPRCLPHVIHIVPIGDGVRVLYLLEIGNPAVSSSLYEAFCHLHGVQLAQIQRDVDTLRPAFDLLDSAIRRLHDALKKSKVAAVENCTRQLTKKWETIRKKYQEFLKNKSDEALLRAETLVLGLLETLKQLLNLTSVDESVVFASQRQSLESARLVCEQLESYSEFLKVKALRNFSPGLDSLTINKYLEEFPGIVHFLYIDRNHHRLTAPTLDFDCDDAGKLRRENIWDMINFSRKYLQEGNLFLIWKDTAFSYSYFLWFEDTNGTFLKPVVFPTNSSKALPLPGLLGDDFYQKLKEVCFPKTPPSKIRCYELFCIHLGLVTASCVLEHTRRLAASIWELRGAPTNPLDLL